MKDSLHHQVLPREPLQELLLKNISNIYQIFKYKNEFMTEKSLKLFVS